MNAAPMRTNVAPPVAPNAVSALVAVATPTAPDRPPEHDAGAARRFAELLRQSRSERATAARPAPAPPPPALAPANATGDPTPGDDVRAAEPVLSPSPTRNAKAPAPIARSATGQAAVEHNARTSREPAAHDADRGGDDAPVPTRSSTAESASSLGALAAAAGAENAADPRQVDPAAQGDESAAASAGDADLSTALFARNGARHSGIHARGEAAVDAASGRASAAGDAAAAASRLQLGAATAPALFGDALRAVEGRALNSRGVDAATVSLAAGSVARAFGETQGVAAQPAALAMATPIDAPEFAAALGIQVSVLAKGGVQHAELHLNPAETGPLSIHIAVDGTAARVDFGADLAATRQAIERGLPELASALRDAGLTLSGGGVSQHAGSRAGGDSAAAPPERRAANGGTALPDATPARVTARVAAGGVDLYA